MPAMRVLVDGAMVATFSPEAYGVMSASVAGTKIDEELASSLKLIESEEGWIEWSMEKC